MYLKGNNHIGLLRSVMAIVELGDVAGMQEGVQATERTRLYNTSISTDMYVRVCMYVYMFKYEYECNS